ncbi:DUF2157 domain-containing protein [Mesorhizobium xinjiangense]|uniref:DUF2157 domain-containing protein n=1 Tax=Mesorhizobium xinjiangense TaxID=2678685 RepID=UPI001F46FED1|nr:DUF2157 domain-containing protein [Mesorhizobium xinjiangense]
MNYAARVKNDIGRWRSRGWIDASAAERMTRDVEKRAARTLGFGAILAVLAAILFAAAILIFIAANWEAIAHLVRVAMLFMLIFAGYVGGAVLKSRGLDGAGEGAWIVAAAAFGGAIALIAQMYHLSGEEADAVFTWGAGVALAALVLRSPALTVVCVALSGVWLSFAIAEIDMRQPFGPAVGYPVVAAILWSLSLWTASRPSRHLLLLLLIYYGLLQYLRADDPAVAIAVAAVSVGYFVLCALRPRMAERLLAIGQARVHGLIGFGAAMMLLQLRFGDGTAFALLAFLTFAGAVAALVLGGRDSAPVRWLAYLLFAVELCVVYLATIGTMLGTAGFLLAAALLLAAIATVIFRFERRLRDEQNREGART